MKKSRMLSVVSACIFSLGLISTTLLIILPGSAIAASFAYISNLQINNVSVIDTSSNTVVDTVAVGTAPSGVAVNPAGTRVYVANIGSDNVSVIDTSSNTVVDTVVVGDGPRGVAVNPAGTYVYITNYDGHNVSVIDTSSNTVVDAVAVESYPEGVAVNPAGTDVYVVNGYNNVSVIDTSSNTVVDTVVVGESASGVAVNPAGTYVYVVNSFSNNVSVIDTSSNTVVDTVAVGSWPEGVAVNPAGTYVYVTNYASNNVSVIDTSSNTVVDTVVVGDGPRGVAVNPAGTDVYILNYSNNVSVIDTSSHTVVDEVAVGRGPYSSLGLFIGPDVPIDLYGSIKTAGEQDICAMVLASGEYMFSCNTIGVFSLTDLPRENNGTVKRQIYAHGFSPKIDILTRSTSEAVVMTRSGTCPSYNTPYNPAVMPGSSGNLINISGKVLLQNSPTPICAMVLANGEYMFSCDGTGSYALNIPLDANGQYKLQVYAQGFAPMVQRFDEFTPNVEARLARAAECQ